MKFMGFAATYSPALKKGTNKQNYFMNGITKDLIDENCCADICSISKMRNLYAVADGSKSEVDGTDIALVCMDMLHNISDADFSKACNYYFNNANRMVQSRSFSNNGASMSMDIAVIYLYQGWAKLFNYGNISVFHKHGNTFTDISGKAPKTIEIDKVVKHKDELMVKKVVEKNTPYIGHISEDMEVVPYISEPIRMKSNDSLIAVTESVTSVLSKSDILAILNNDDISQDEKAMAIIRKAVQKNPDGNYTVEYIAKGTYKPVFKLKAKWILLAVAAILAVVIAFAIPKGTTDEVDTGVENETEIEASTVVDNNENEIVEEVAGNADNKDDKDMPITESKPQQTVNKPVQATVNNQSKPSVPAAIKGNPLSTVEKNEEKNPELPDTMTSPEVTEAPSVENNNTEPPKAQEEPVNPIIPETPVKTEEQETEASQTPQDIQDIISTW